MVGFAPVNKPVKVAFVIAVGDVRMKSSADSISNLPAVSGRVALAIKLVGPPVLKENGSAAAGNTIPKPSISAETAKFISKLRHCISP